MGIYILLYLKWITNKGLPCSTWNSAQCYMAAWMGGEFGGEWIYVYVYVCVCVYVCACVHVHVYVYVYVWLSLFTVHLKLSQHC